jgi:hypothetical protein
MLPLMKALIAMWHRNLREGARNGARIAQPDEVVLG